VKRKIAKTVRLLAESPDDNGLYRHILISYDTVAVLEPTCRIKVYIIDIFIL
jgi:hypothetical protein